MMDTIYTITPLVMPSEWPIFGPWTPLNVAAVVGAVFTGVIVASSRRG
jgi:hypothetical protein